MSQSLSISKEHNNEQIFVYFDQDFIGVLTLQVDYFLKS